MPVKEVTLQADCPAVRIPAGDTLTLPAGGTYDVAQALGGSVTLRAPEGLFRVAPEHFDALGAEFAAAHAAEATAAADEPFSEELVWSQLRQCFDPEIPLNIVDLGLIYNLETSVVEGGQHDVAVTMTLTAPGCGMGPTIAEDARQKVEALPSVRQARVDITWDPQWTAHMISEEGRKVLGLD
ncbi:MAG: iron-sulfur cluster assembly protein [Opitutales bacterium]